MSASIRWAPAEGGKSLDVGGPSNFIAIMEAAFGAFPLVLNESDVPVMRGIVAAQKGAFPEKGFADLLAALEDHGTVRVWAVW